MMLTNLDFADDIALIPDRLIQAQGLLSRVETECENNVRLRLNLKKTEFLTFNLPDEPLKTIGNVQLKKVEDFKNLGSWLKISDTDFKVHKAIAWKVLNQMKNVWCSRLRQELKVKLFLVTVASVLKYACEAWAMTAKLTKAIDGIYTRMLKVVHQVSWRVHITNLETFQSCQQLKQCFQKKTMSPTAILVSKHAHCSLLCHNDPSIISRESMDKHNFSHTLKLQSAVVIVNIMSRSLKSN